MEVDVKTFNHKQHNVLGEKIESRVADINQLTNKETLTLKR